MTAAVTPPTETVAISVSSPLAPRDVGVALIGSPNSTAPDGSADGRRTGRIRVAAIAGAGDQRRSARRSRGPMLRRVFCRIRGACRRRRAAPAGTRRRRRSAAERRRTCARGRRWAGEPAPGPSRSSASCTPTSSVQCGSISIKIGADDAANVTGTISPVVRDPDDRCSTSTWRRSPSWLTKSTVSPGWTESVGRSGVDGHDTRRRGHVRRAGERHYLIGGVRGHREPQRRGRDNAGQHQGRPASQRQRHVMASVAAARSRRGRPPVQRFARDTSDVVVPDCASRHYTARPPPRRVEVDQCAWSSGIVTERLMSPAGRTVDSCVLEPTSTRPTRSPRRPPARPRSSSSS